MCFKQLIEKIIPAEDNVNQIRARADVDGGNRDMSEGRGMPRQPLARATGYADLRA